MFVCIFSSFLKFFAKIYICCRYYAKLDENPFRK